MDIYFCEYGMIRLLMNLFLELIKKDGRDKMMKLRKILLACIIGGGFLMFLLLKYNPRNNRAYLENRIGTEVSRVYPTQNLEDLFEQFPNGFIVYQVRQVNENNVKIKLTGTEKGAPIKGELIETERESGENTRVVSVEYYNGKYTYSDEKTANELWPQQSFLFQKITLNKDFLSTLKLKDKYYSSMNGSFELNMMSIYQKSTSIYHFQHQKPLNYLSEVVTLIEIITTLLW